MILSTASLSLAQTTNLPEASPVTVQTLAANPETDFEYFEGKITRYIGKATEVVIPSTIKGMTITEVATLAFSKCDFVESVVIPETVTMVGIKSFQGCSALKSVQFPSKLTQIGEYAFSGCSSLEVLEFPTTLTQIDQFAFEDCTSLTSIILPSKLSTLSAGVFYRCSSVASIFLPVSLKRIEEYAFFGCKALHTFYYDGKESQKADIYVDSTVKSTILAMNWVYVDAPPKTTVVVNQVEGIPTWAQTYANFIAPVFMPDISATNYDISANRGLIAQTLYNMEGNGANVTPTHNFSDVGDYGTAIAWCHANSIMSGNTPNFFGTDQDITREQFALILQQMATVTGTNSVEADDSVLNIFADAASISSWARRGMQWAVANGLMVGTNGTLNPSGKISRIEVAVMLYNFDKL